MDNPYVRSMSAIKQAVDYNIIKSKEDGMYWMDSGRLIVTTPVGQDTIQVMTRFCMTEKGASVYDEIVNRLEKID
jgi:ATP-dependent RNA circularization protein (DNA/RNA ligase family)